MEVMDYLTKFSFPQWYIALGPLGTQWCYICHAHWASSIFLYNPDCLEKETFTMIRKVENFTFKTFWGSTEEETKITSTMRQIYSVRGRRVVWEQLIWGLLSFFQQCISVGKGIYSIYDYDVKTIFFTATALRLRTNSQCSTAPVKSNTIDLEQGIWSGYDSTALKTNFLVRRWSDSCPAPPITWSWDECKLYIALSSYLIRLKWKLLACNLCPL